MGRARLTNDALLAMSAARNGMTILTANARHFASLSEFHPFPLARPTALAAALPPQLSVGQPPIAQAGVAATPTPPSPR